MSSFWQHFKQLVRQHVRLLAYVVGSSLISLWTVLRHITNGVNFDVVGQVGLSQQWSHCIHSGSVLGSTNYLLKMPVYALTNQLHFLSPMNRLLLLALVFNLLTFTGLFLVVEKLLDLEKIHDRSWFYLSVIWLATISGSVFWLDYANSRNIETVGGIFLIYLAIKFIKTKDRRDAVLLASIGSIVFFADPLQLYIVGFGTSVFCAYRWITSRAPADQNSVLVVLGALLAGLVGSKVLLYFTKLFMPVSYLAVPGQHFALTFNNLLQALKASSLSLIKIFDADFAKRPYSPNAIREFLNFVVLGFMTVLIIKLLASKNQRLKFLALLPILLLANLLIYIASGQALEANTVRYFIMIPLVTILFFSIYVPVLPLKNKQGFQRAWLVIIIISSGLLVGALIKSWPDRHSKDQHIYQQLSYLRQNDFQVALGSLDEGVTVTYFSQGQETVLPIDCRADGIVRKISLFYDVGAFKSLKDYKKDIPVMLPASDKSLASNMCGRNFIIAAYGAPKKEQAIPGVGVVLLYAADKIKISN